MPQQDQPATEPDLLVTDREGVRTIRWNRPDALNAMSMELWDGTAEALRSAPGAGISAIVLTGTGRAFTAGQDLAEMTDPRHADEAHGFRNLVAALVATPVPLIAAVNGLAVGFGTTVLPWCDIVLVSPEARFRVPFVPLGVTTELGSSVTLPSVMGAQAASRFVLTGDWLSADDAVATGLASQVVEAADLLTAAEELAGRLAAQPPDALRTTTGLLRAGRTEAWLAAIEREYAEFARLAGGPENLAAIEAFFTRS